MSGNAPARPFAPKDTAASSAGNTVEMTSTEREPMDCTDLFSEIDPLAIWRTIPSSDVTGMMVSRISAALVARGRAAKILGPAEQTLARAEGRDPKAWLELADQLPGAEFSLTCDSGAVNSFLAADVRASSLLVAAFLGSRWAED